MPKYVSILTTPQLDLLHSLAMEFPGQLEFDAVVSPLCVHAVTMSCDSITLADYIGFQLDKLHAMVLALERCYDLPAARR